MSTGRRLAVLQAHLGDGGTTEAPSGLEPHPTSAQQGEGASYSVVLPERLTPKGPWLVRRWVWQAHLAPAAPAAPCPQALGLSIAPRSIAQKLSFPRSRLTFCSRPEQYLQAG